MFTGLVEALGTVALVRDEPPGKRIVVREARFAADATIGESIAVSGCCLTVVAVNGDALAFEAGPETLSRTVLGGLQAGDAVNLERSLRLGDRLGGHFVTGHVDGLGALDSRLDEGDWSTFWFRAPRPLMAHLVSKGSIAVDGVSLTVVEVEADRFSVQLIPHTLSVTTLGRLRPGNGVNLETDLLAKYVEKQIRP
jgi:riboflavin synthase